MSYNPFEMENTPLTPNPEEPTTESSTPVADDVAAEGTEDTADTSPLTAEETPADTDNAAEDSDILLNTAESVDVSETVAENTPDAIETDDYTEAESAEISDNSAAEIPVAENTAPTAATAPTEAPVTPTPQPVYYGAYPPQGNPAQNPARGYYYMPYPMQPPTQPTPPKRKKGATAFLVCMWILIGIFALGFFSMCGYIIGSSVGDTDATVPTLYDEDRNDEPPKKTEPSTTAPAEDNEKDDTEIIPLPDTNEKDFYSGNISIDLNPLPDDSANTGKYTNQYAYKKVAPSTIGVVCYEAGFSGGDPTSQGTGIVLTADGYVATNSHVIGDSRTLYDVRVVVSDGTVYEAKVIGFDSRTDLAVLKINAKNLTPAEFCDSKYVEVGQDVIAVGNPGGIEFQNSLTRGVVSALDRELALSSQVSYIQTDAAINPGNSGGPLCNMQGQVIGINTAKISASSYEGMGFAIPSTKVKEIINDLIAQGYVSDRVRLGISGQEASSSMQQYYGIPKGILIGEISKDGPCDNVGIQTNDVLTKIDGEEVTSFSQIYGILGEHTPGDKVTLTLYRLETNKTYDVTITLMADEGETQQ